MKGTILGEIVQYKATWIKARKKEQPLNTFENLLEPANRHFYNIMRYTEKSIFILECKKASPSNGLLCEEFNPIVIANVYRHYASAISVVTDEKYFKGDFNFIPIISAIVTQPVICKDFIIDPYQIYLARYYKADAVLLMLSLLNNQQYCTLAALAHSMKMGVLTEISNAIELKRALEVNAKVIGINNRDLRNFSIDLNRTRLLAPLLRNTATVISESGIYNYTQIRELRPFVNGFLIGSALMKEKDLMSSVRRIIMGDNKICGLTRSKDAQVAYAAGSIYGGVIFAKDSFRKINCMYLQDLIDSAPLKYVCVLRNSTISEIMSLVSTFQFAVVQLHGNENKKFVNTLREVLPVEVKIWKACNIGQGILPIRDWLGVDRYVFDNGTGGSGQCFNWSLLAGEKDLSNVMLAGGLNANNCFQAAQLGFSGLDFNSGVEITTGIKDSNKIAEVFRILRCY
ncbi:bifunctional indole-3-glycerol-phosphate synthase TrpC/phosphoribosylanthranilate isomerase TrpF [Candidatus Pantoea carbekii]|uniref:bifunctional indole-3-glycerol-phosphate synthase TrpC/phosphoribosylanthranilate isomerase TrpF n=1 Tax=Candidatus Pantoea carbekii TaxID=1235990 RepID=UPI000C79AF47|nr:bifunctional indole-3-glycerol-phosphate synthase TrpC/phosphoribosylanthranilate isomerase TrpF [Candidatus Pantoea carbekii]